MLFLLIIVGWGRINSDSDIAGFLMAVRNWVQYCCKWIDGLSRFVWHPNVDGCYVEEELNLHLMGIGVGRGTQAFN